MYNYFESDYRLLVTKLTMSYKKIAPFSLHKIQKIPKYNIQALKNEVEFSDKLELN